MRIISKMMHAFIRSPALTAVHRTFVISSNHLCNQSLFPTTVLLRERCCNVSHHRYFCRLTKQYFKETRIIAPLFLYAREYPEKVAIIDQHGEHRYQDLIARASKIALDLEKILDVKQTKMRLNGARVASLCSNDISYVVAQWGTWVAEGVFVPLGPDQSLDDFSYRLQDSEASVVIVQESLADKIRPVTDKLKIPLKVLKESEYLYSSNKKFKFWDVLKGRPYGMTSNAYEKKVYEGYYTRKPAAIIYTSGTTADPKGVVLTYGNLQAQMDCMVEAWNWSSSDTILHVLPLYHVHGIVNVLMTPLYCGATCVMHPRFNAEMVWNELMGRIEELQGYRVNLFMAVPTIYAKLLDYYKSHIMEECGTITRAFLKSEIKNNIRLMVSGSDALPSQTLNKWYDVTGHFLLERYGMTEIGMALTNKLKTVTRGSEEEKQKLVGCVGNPFPGVEVRIVTPNVYNEAKYDLLCHGTSVRTQIYEDKKIVQKDLMSKGPNVVKQYSSSSDEKTVQGELLIKGPNVFKQYWRKKQQTEESFTEDGWFKTGDFVEFNGEYYKILGRMSVDIIKNGGFKVSALHIERHLCQHPAVNQVAVIGTPHPTWGQSVMAVVVPKEGTEVTLKELQDFSEDRLTKYEKPTVLKVVDSLPRNHMGKVNKKLLAKELIKPF